MTILTGKHLIVDCINIGHYQLLEKIETIEPLMTEIVREMKLTVVGELRHQFEPYGATILYLLSESHLSIHTYVEERYVAIDLYCCNPKIEMDNVLDIIYKFFDCECIIKKKILDR